MTTKYEYTDDMAEISGFGGGYEETCRKMVVGGLEWWDAHPNADPRFYGYKDLYGVLMEDNEDASTLSKAMMDAIRDAEGNADATGAMHQACVGHIMNARKMGWPAYQEKMREMKREATDEPEGPEPVEG